VSRRGITFKPAQRLETVVTGDVYQVEVTAVFKPHRVDVQFVPSKEAQIKPLVEHLSFIKHKSHWGAAFRFGHVEVPGSDFALIAERMELRGHP
jgi:hypothetical protein